MKKFKVGINLFGIQSSLQIFVSSLQISKVSVKSLFLMNIVNVEMETAGAGIDDSEITITYLENISLKAHNEHLSFHKFEFPKKTDILPLYTYLLELAYHNRLKINGLDL